MAEQRDHEATEQRDSVNVNPNDEDYEENRAEIHAAADSPTGDEAPADDRDKAHGGTAKPDAASDAHETEGDESLPGDNPVVRSLIFAAVSAAIVALIAWFVLPLILESMGDGSQKERVEAVSSFFALSVIGYCSIFSLAVIFVIRPDAMRSRWQTIILLTGIGLSMLVLPALGTVYDGYGWVFAANTLILVITGWLLWHRLFQMRPNWLRRLTGGAKED